MSTVRLPSCSHCDSSQVKFNKVKGYWRCLNDECELTFEAPEPTCDSEQFRPQRIFLSYGHDQNAILVDHISNLLSEAGHYVWVDHKGIQASDDWREAITRGIRDSDRILSFLSKHSVRDPGVCLDEIGIALSVRHGAIATLLVESANEVKVPPSVSHIQYLDLSNWFTIYNEGGEQWTNWLKKVCDEILEVIRKNASFAGEMDRLNSMLRPVPQYALLGSLIKEPFVGRQWVFEEIERWRLNERAERMFLLLSGPGMGKSMISAYLAHSSRLRTVAYHFCRWNQPESRDAKSFVLNLAYQLAARSPSYRLALIHSLQRLESIKPLAKWTSFELFNNLISEIGNGVIDGGQSTDRLIVIVDALDEAPEIAKLLAQVFNHPTAYFPAWIAVFATSRPEQEISTSLINNVFQFSLDPGDERNKADLKELVAPLQQNIADSSWRQIENQLLTASCGSVFYLALVKRWHSKGQFNFNDLTSLPVGLEGLYHEWFDRQFAESIESWDKVKPLLRLLCASPGALPLTIATNLLGWQNEDDQETISLLGGLVRWSTGELSFTHATFAKWLVKTQGQYRISIQESSEQLITYITRAIPKLLIAERMQYEHTSLPILLEKLEESRLKDLVACGQVDLDQLGALASHLGGYLEFKARTTSRDFYQSILRVTQLTKGQEHPETLIAMGNLASTLSDQGEYQAARELTEEVLALSKRILGEEHPETLIVMGNLASTLFDLGEYQAARELKEKVLTLCKRILGEEHPGTLIAMGNLASTLSHLGEYQTARELQEEVLALWERILGEEHPDTLTATSNLAVSLSNLGEHEYARELQEKVLALRKRTLGEKHPDTLNAMSSLANHLLHLCEYQAARELQEKVVALRKRILGEEHPHTLSAMGNLALSLSHLGEHQAARELQKEVLALYLRTLGEEHPEILTAMGNLASTLSLLGEYQAARGLQEKVVPPRQRILGKEHPDTLIAMHNLANILSYLGEHQAARKLQEEVLSLYQRISGEEHPNNLIAMYSLAVSLSNLGEYQAARELLEKVVALRQRISGGEHPNDLISMHSLAACLSHLGEYQAARELQEKILALRQRISGNDHPDTLSAMRNLASSLTKLGEHQAARELLTKAVNLRQRVSGEEHPDPLL